MLLSNDLHDSVKKSDSYSFRVPGRLESPQMTSCCASFYEDQRGTLQWLNQKHDPAGHARRTSHPNSACRITSSSSSERLNMHIQTNAGGGMEHDRTLLWKTLKQPYRIECLCMFTQYKLWSCLEQPNPLWFSGDKCLCKKSVTMMINSDHCNSFSVPYSDMSVYQKHSPSSWL